MNDNNDTIAGVLETALEAMESTGEAQVKIIFCISHIREALRLLSEQAIAAVGDSMDGSHQLSIVRPASQYDRKREQASQPSKVVVDDAMVERAIDAYSEVVPQCPSYRGIRAALTAALQEPSHDVP